MFGKRTRVAFAALHGTFAGATLCKHANQVHITHATNPTAWDGNDRWMNIIPSRPCSESFLMPCTMQRCSSHTDHKPGSGGKFQAEISVTFGTEQPAIWNIHLLRTPPSSPTSFSELQRFGFAKRFHLVTSFRRALSPKLFEGRQRCQDGSAWGASICC